MIVYMFNKYKKHEIWTLQLISVLFPHKYLDYQQFRKRLLSKIYFSFGSFTNKTKRSQSRCVETCPKSKKRCFFARGHSFHTYYLQKLLFPHKYLDYQQSRKLVILSFSSYCKRWLFFP